MNAKIIRRLNMLKSIVSFMSEFPILALPRASAVLAEIVATIVTLEAAARDQVGGNGRKKGAVDVRESIANELRAYLKDVNRTARTLDFNQPGIRPIFRLPKSGSFPALVATARNIISVAASMEAAFLDAGMPATFLIELKALLTKFEEATGEKISGRLARVKATAALKLAADRGVLAATKLDACARNHFRKQPEILAAWIQARHIERNPVRSKPSAPTEGRAQQDERTHPETTNALVSGACRNEVQSARRDPICAPSSDPAQSVGSHQAAASEPDRVGHVISEGRA